MRPAPEWTPYNRMRSVAASSKWHSFFFAGGKPQLGLNGLRAGVPIHRALAEIGLIRHVAGQRRMMPEHHILNHRLARPHRLEKFPYMRAQIVVIVAFEAGTLRRWLLPLLRIVLFMP